MVCLRPIPGHTTAPAVKLPVLSQADCSQVACTEPYPTQLCLLWAPTKQAVVQVGAAAILYYGLFEPYVRANLLV